MPPAHHLSSTDLIKPTRPASHTIRPSPKSSHPPIINSLFPISFTIKPSTSKSPAMASPATLPITNNQSMSENPITTPALRSFLSRLSTSLRQSLAQSRPWTELIDRTAFSRPENLTDAVSRIRKNATYFRVNYLTLLFAVLAFSLISHPFSLLLLSSLLAAWFFLYLFRPADQPVVIFGRTFSSRETLTMLVLLTIVIIFLTSVGSLLISAVLIGAGIASVHGAFRVPEDLFLDDQEGPNSGFLSFLGGAASSAAAVAGPAVAGRV